MVPMRTLSRLPEIVASCDFLRWMMENSDGQCLLQRYVRFLLDTIFSCSRAWPRTRSCCLLLKVKVKEGWWSVRLGDGKNSGMKGNRSYKSDMSFDSASESEANLQNWGSWHQMSDFPCDIRLVHAENCITRFMITFYCKHSNAFPR